MPRFHRGARSTTPKGPTDRLSRSRVGVAGGDCRLPIASGLRMTKRHDPEGSHYRNLRGYRGIDVTNQAPGGNAARVLTLTCPPSTMKKVPRWRNGRRGGLKIRFLQGSVGSSPSLGIRPCAHLKSYPRSPLRDSNRLSVRIPATKYVHLTARIRGG